MKNISPACLRIRHAANASNSIDQKRPATSFHRVFIGAVAIILSTTVTATEPSEVEPFHEANAEHCDQFELLGISDQDERFEEAFECGDELFETAFNMLDGVGANVGDNLRFTGVPRADKSGADEWRFHFPERSTGPNAEACTICHIGPFEDGAGAAGVNVVRDPLHSADIGQFIQRNTPHLFGAGALQRLAEELTEEVQSAVLQAQNMACLQGAPLPVSLEAKNISYGTVVVDCSGNHDMSGLEGIDSDLVVKPFQWKGNTTTLREFNRDASHNELGMQAVELVGYNVDGDGDQVTNEFTVGDITALTVYLAAQPRPSSKIELNKLRLLDLSREEIRNIRRGEVVFGEAGCADCHLPKMAIRNPTFSEPSQTREFREQMFPAGQSTAAEGVDPADPIAFDLTADHPDNILRIRGKEVRFGSFERTRYGGAIVRLYGDLKRHEMGDELAENIDETGTGASVWLTKELWGVGSTAPYLHDGRATTLTEAILDHGGDAEDSTIAAATLSEADFSAMIAFLDNLILFKVVEEEVVIMGKDKQKRSSRNRH